MTTINPMALESLPSYEQHELHDEDSAPLLVQDAQMNEGLQIHESIEDEGIDMGVGYNNIGINTGTSIASQWNFDNLGLNSRPSNRVSGTGSDIGGNNHLEPSLDLDDLSDAVEHNSSASAGSLQGRLEDLNNSIAEGDDGPFVDQSPVPDVDDDAQMDVMALHRDLQGMQAQRSNLLLRPDFEVTADDHTEEIEEPATEIHVEEGEGLKLD